MSEHSCGSGCGCGPKSASASASTGTSSSTSTSTPASSSSSKKGAIQNGKGSGPRNMSKTFLKNYDGIRWESAGKKRKEGSKFVKVY